MANIYLNMEIIAVCRETQRNDLLAIITKEEE
jgi:hypothetical protein